MLRFYDDMTEPEVAAALGVSVGTVKSTVARAVAKLRLDAELGVDAELGTRGQSAARVKPSAGAARLNTSPDPVGRSPSAPFWQTLAFPGYAEAVELHEEVGSAWTAR
jgi:hypothetical protein